MAGDALSRLTLVLGGARSGKSTYAERLIEECPPPWTYVATAEAFDDEMRARIAQHRVRRDGRWQTIDAPRELAGVISSREVPRPLLIDCLTLWLSNTLLAGADLTAETDRLIDAFAAAEGPIVAVSNEVGMGIVPDTPLGRQFRDAQGRLNQRLAAIADRVFLLAAGLPLTLK